MAKHARVHNHPVRLCVSQAYWLLEFTNEEDEVTQEAFDSLDETMWSTGETTKPGDIQVFAFSKNLDTIDVGPELRAAVKRELEGDPRVDAVHSIWVATSEPGVEENNDEWPIQAYFECLVRLRHPVPKQDLLDAGLLKRTWPQNRRGRLFKQESVIQTLAKVLSDRNPAQKEDIWEAFGWNLKRESFAKIANRHAEACVETLLATAQERELDSDEIKDLVFDAILGASEEDQSRL